VRAAFGLSLLAAPALFLVAALVSPGVTPPGTNEDPATQLSIVASDRGRYYLATVLVLVATYVLLAAILALVLAARADRPKAAYAGGALAVVGAVALTDGLMISVVQWAMTKPGIPRAPMVEVFRENYGGGITAVYLTVIALPIGFVVLAVALRRARLVPLWQAILLGISFAAWWVADTGTSRVPGIVAGVILALGLGPMGWGLLRAVPEDTHE